jgi:putative flippase GtrA
MLKLKFLGVGFVNLIFGYSVYAGLIYMKLPYARALFLATVIGVAFNFFSYGRLVFAAGGGVPVLFKFIASYALVYLLNVIMLAGLTHYLSTNPYVGQAVCLPTNVMLSWLLMKNWVYIQKAKDE